MPVVPARAARRNAALTAFATCSRALGAEPGHFTGRSVLIASGDPATPTGERRIRQMKKFDMYIREYIH